MVFQCKAVTWALASGRPRLDSSPSWVTRQVSLICEMGLPLVCIWFFWGLNERMYIKHKTEAAHNLPRLPGSLTDLSCVPPPTANNRPLANVCRMTHSPLRPYKLLVNHLFIHSSIFHTIIEHQLYARYRARATGDKKVRKQMWSLLECSGCRQGMPRTV